MSPAVRMALLVLALAAGACARDPWADLKPHQMLEKAEQLFQQGDPNAEKALRTAFDKAIRADIGFVSMRNYALPLFQFYALRGDLKSAEPLFERVNRPPEEVYVHLHAANNLVILYARAGRIDDARRVMAKAMRSIAMTSPVSGSDGRSVRMVILANFDRISSAANDTDTSASCFEMAIALLEDLSRFQMSQHWPLEPGVKPFLERYAGFLRVGGRNADAQRLEELLTKIESNARSGDTPVECITQERHTPVWCLLEVR